MRECCYDSDKWNVLIIDDEVDVLSVTKFALFNFKYMGRKLNLINATSKAEAIEKLKENRNIAVAFIDIIMEESDSGLKLVEYIREELNDYKMRLIIRTGQPGEYPEREVIERYEINDYKSKDELTENELYCTMTTALRAYCDLLMLEYYKDLEHKLIQDSKMVSMGEMVGMIAHQWQQPLNIISFITSEMELLYENNKLDKFDYERYISQVFRQVKYMSQTVTDFREFLKPAKDNSSFSVKKSIESIFNILNVILRDGFIKYSIKGLDDYFINGIESEFKQAIINIITNSKDVINSKNIKDGFIEIDIEKRDELIISIRDNGGGVKEELLPDKLFENYVTTKGEKGNGIGLYITKYIIEKKFHGSISCQNLERGAEFIIRVPNV